MTATLHRGTALHVLATIPDESVAAVVTDPPYGLSREPDITEVLTHWLAGDDYDHGSGGFMGKEWDSFVKGAHQRTKNRVAKGVCPCCNRSFTNLAKHMAGQHPDFGDPDPR